MRATCRYACETLSVVFAVWERLKNFPHLLRCAERIITAWVPRRGRRDGRSQRGANIITGRLRGGGAVLGEVVGPLQDSVGLPGWPGDRTPGDAEKVVS